MLRKLAAYERQNQVDLALQEIGKVERTLFMLDWLEDPALSAAAMPGSTRASSATPLPKRSTPSIKAASSIVHRRRSSIVPQV
jgi:hypothetical protein